MTIYPQFRAHRRAGFTLIEMMIVVVIIGVLAALAIPTFRGYLYASKTTEATTFLGEIRQRQESYRSEHSQYCDVGVRTGAPSFAPATVPGSAPVMWPGDAAGTPVAGRWAQLGAAPDGAVYFQYTTVAGPPGAGNDPTASMGSTLGYNGTDFWFVAQARADLDADNTILTMETYSENSGIYVSEEKGWE